MHCHGNIETGIAGEVEMAANGVNGAEPLSKKRLVNAVARRLARAGAGKRDALLAASCNQSGTIGGCECLFNRSRAGESGGARREPLKYGGEIRK
jgi:hypothetical protein